MRYTLHLTGTATHHVEVAILVDVTELEILSHVEHGGHSLHRLVLERTEPVWAASDDGSIRLEGRFEGVFQGGAGGQPIRIEDGTLTVEGIPPGMILRR